MAKSVRLLAQGTVFSDYVRAGYPLLLAGSPQIGISFARRLRPDYTGPLIEVRRSSDDTTTTIGTDSSGFLDEAALLAFCGSGDGFVRTAYNQGDGPNYSRSDNAAQPQIVEAGVVHKRNGRPTVKFTGGQYLVATHNALQYSVDQASALVVGECNNSDATAAHLFMVPVNNTGTGIRYSLTKTSASSNLTAYGRRADGESTAAVSVPNLPGLAQITGTWNFVTRDMQIRRNAQSSVVAQMAVAGTTPATGQTGTVGIGAAAYNGALWLEGYISEIMVYTTDVSAQLDALRKNQRVFYSI